MTSTANKTTSSLRIAFLHLAPELGALDRNCALIESGTRIAAGLGAEWVLSGELVIPGYRFTELTGTSWIAPPPDRWLRRLTQLSADLGVVSFISHPERAVNGQLFNSLFVISHDGRMLGRQRKLYPTPGSEGWTSPGELSPPVLIDGINVGLLICADAYPAEPAQQLRAGGAQLLVSSAAWWPGQWGPKGEWEARTLDTDLPMLVCNRTGLDGQSDMSDAESVVVDRGVKLLALRSPESTVFVVDFQFRNEHIVNCDLAATASVVLETAQHSPP